MNKTTKFIAWLIFLAAIASTGMLFKNFTGGLASGFSISLIFLSTYGKYLAQKSIRKIDKHIKDLRKQYPGK